MSPRRLLVTLSAAQLVAGLAGLALAVRRRVAYDIRVLRGRPEHVGRDALWMGTAYSAPLPMLLAQAWATGRLARGSDDAARPVLGALGAAMVPGYLIEHSVRRRLRPGGWDPVETPVVVAGLGLAAAMAVLGRRGAPGG